MSHLIYRIDIFSIFHVEGDGRLVPATDDEVIEVEDMLDDKSSLHFSCETGMTVKTTHNGHDLKSDDEIEKQVVKNAPPTGLVQNQQPLLANAKILDLYYKAEDSMEHGMQIWEELEEQRLNGLIVDLIQACIRLSHSPSKYPRRPTLHRFQVSDTAWRSASFIRRILGLDFVLAGVILLLSLHLHPLRLSTPPSPLCQVAGGARIECALPTTAASASHVIDESHRDRSATTCKAQTHFRGSSSISVYEFAAPEGSFVLLHGCAHNPTSIAPTPQQCEKIADVIHAEKHFLFFDVAYQV
ncbi:hypothetical protein L2E82_50145 [Cichorium intybus]|nr:hypothetical protein L2E82_50145 [Cichorium intybus]